MDIEEKMYGDDGARTYDELSIAEKVAHLRQEVQEFRELLAELQTPFFVEEVEKDMVADEVARDHAQDNKI